MSTFAQSEFPLNKALKNIKLFIAFWQFYCWKQWQRWQLSRVLYLPIVGLISSSQYSKLSRTRAILFSWLDYRKTKVHWSLVPSRYSNKENFGSWFWNLVENGKKIKFAYKQGHSPMLWTSCRNAQAFASICLFK